MSHNLSSSRSPDKRRNDPSLDTLATRLNDTHISTTDNLPFVGGFREATSSNLLTHYDRTKPLPPVPIPSVPLSLQAGPGWSATGLQSLNIQMPVPTIPTVPQPESLTMGYARSAPPNVLAHSLPDTDNGWLGPPQWTQSTSQHSKPTLSSLTISPSSTPLRPRAASTPVTPISPGNGNTTIQCAGTTKSGKRCTRLVRAPPLASFFTDEASEAVERFCFQHVKEVLEPTGFYSRKAGKKWIEFSDWIPSYLSPDTQAALRAEMEKPPSAKDEPGYIYAYEIRDGRATDSVKIKVGRAVKLVKRLDQWSKQCTSKEVILRGWWPGTVVHDDDASNTSLLKGTVKAGEKGPLCHRLERLVHLELADLVVHTPYLEPGFPKVTYGNGFPASGAKQAGKSRKAQMPNAPCLDCGSIHKEIFAFKRIKQGKHKDSEWERIVQPVIAKWGYFVHEFV